ncbi:protein translocase subunit SecF [Corynebacterium sp. ES2794-CONJ1]|uniref:protein translocase subunit SecF n=1 Tax=unclassified Corynebacterium TaxID=2624378 RepID=UPI002169563E|nr:MULTISPECIES: protein translocase subunit SecF [unclassified Corynebacterium]MCS4489228.1 protein translocase subunit SecF [Corynebacterium sp. ES2775-CONJ]MCS4531078.1 protein translocase subunit SecF [Corynebacterium sp. ES2730-CONJ]MCU9518445.1 protein translocase subunit SecF [Corynebacterium sp. ES2794-CONJ1]
MSSKTTLEKIFTGEGGLDFVGKRRVSYMVTLAIIVVCLLCILFRGFNLGIDFQGGTKMNMPAGNLDKVAVSQTFEEATGIEPALVQIVGSGDTRILEINSERLTQEQIDSARRAIFDEYQPENLVGEATPDVIGDSTVSESWGSTITNRMFISMGVFLLAVFIYIAIRLQREMAVAALGALGVDLVFITGLYALFGFEVTPATVIGLLTVLAFSLYDTVIVFDKVGENTAGYLGNRKMTYAEHANLAINQTVMRSISTTVISVLPMIALMVVAVWLMGVGTLKDLALVQLIGVIEGTISSIFLATPFLVSLKNRSAKTKEHNVAVEQLRETGRIDADVLADLDGAPKRQIQGPDLNHRGPSSWRPRRV